MRRPLKGCTLALVVVGLIAVQWSLTAQTPSASKRPLSYDVVDYWRSIQGTRLSNDGQWLAYALTSQAEDGELVVRNLQDGPGVQVTARHGPDVHAGRQVRRLHDRAEQGRRREGAPGRPQASQAQAAGGQGRAGRDRARRRRPPRTAADRPRHHDAARRQGDDHREGRQLPRARRNRPPGSPTTRVSAARAAARGGAGRRRGAAERGGGGRRGAPAAGGARPQAQRARPRRSPREKRKDPGSDLDPPQPRHRRRDDDPRGHRVRLRHEGRAGSPTPPRRPTPPKDGAFARDSPTAR